MDRLQFYVSFGKSQFNFFLLFQNSTFYQQQPERNLEFQLKVMNQCILCSSRISSSFFLPFICHESNVKNKSFIHEIKSNVFDLLTFQTMT
jgi:hypothetical protein